MGHMRNQLTPDTAQWRPVVAAIAEGDDVPVVADATMKAAEKGLELAKSDAGLSHAIWLMAQMVMAAREDNLVAAFTERSIDAGDATSAIDIIAGFSEAMDHHLAETCSRTDIGEMAQLAASETLSALVGETADGLFGESRESVQQALREFSTKSGFATLAYTFFSRFTERYLGYHLSRELSQHVGINQRFSDPAAHSEFLEKLGAHSRQVALIVREFAGGWYSKSRFETGISKRSARGFASYSLTKIRDELRRRGQRHVS